MQHVRGIKDTWHVIVLKTTDNNASFLVVVRENKATCSSRQGNEASFQVVVQENKAVWLVFRIFLNISRQHVGEIKATWNYLTRQRVWLGIFQGRRSSNQGRKSCDWVIVRKINAPCFRNQGYMACFQYAHDVGENQGIVASFQAIVASFKAMCASNQGSDASFHVVIRDIKATCSSNQGNEASFRVVVQEIKAMGLVFRPSFDISKQRVGGGIFHEPGGLASFDISRQCVMVGNFQGYRLANLGCKACNQVTVHRINAPC
ncbi:unnamed protein product [Lactuca saligna]|uniref:Uncharacterized protein n=1 Tax=Lactuca saligna TaxID=75948 RepID=A0AA36EA51_LACSI|nr:unnamed protein product [Lactuca saligna]